MVDLPFGSRWIGVNLGGWLVLERWITPSLFKGVLGSDEFSFCDQLGKDKFKRLKAHRDTFITTADFKWLKQQGINCVRLPVPHWLFEDDAPFVACSEYVDFVFEQTNRHGLSVLLDLHTAPGSQNGNDHSGKQGKVEWHRNAGNVESTLQVLEQLGQQYGQQPNLIGIEVLNEPSDKIPHGFLLDFYRRAHEKLRTQTKKTIIFSDAFQPGAWRGAFAGMTDVMLDTHLYRAFGKDLAGLPIHRHLQAILNDWPNLLADMQKDVEVIVGEWSLGLDPHAFRGLDSYERDKALQALASAQLKIFKATSGHFFWTYKTEDMAGWSFRDVVQSAWLPALIQ